jgi:hypothetical protein
LPSGMYGYQSHCTSSALISLMEISFNGVFPVKKSPPNQKVKVRTTFFAARTFLLVVWRFF